MLTTPERRQQCGARNPCDCRSFPAKRESSIYSGRPGMNRCYFARGSPSAEVPSRAATRPAPSQAPARTAHAATTPPSSGSEPVSADGHAARPLGPAPAPSSPAPETAVPVPASSGGSGLEGGATHATASCMRGGPRASAWLLEAHLRGAESTLCSAMLLCTPRAQGGAARSPRNAQVDAQPAGRVPGACDEKVGSGERRQHVIVAGRRRARQRGRQGRSIQDTRS